MFKQSASHSSSPSCSNRAVCQAMFLVAAILFQSFPAPTRGAVLAKTNPEKKIASDPTSKRQNLPAPKVFPQPAPVTQKPSAPQAAVIVATNRDSFPDHTNGGKAVQGDVINYSVAITNTGDANATSVVFNDTVDVNTSTLVGGSPQILFTLTGDTYSAIEIGRAHV